MQLLLPTLIEPFSAPYSSSSLKNAEAWFSRSIALTEDQDDMLWQGLGDTLWFQNRHREAMAAWKTATNKDGDFLITRGLNEQAENDFDAAMLWFDIATQAAPHSIYGWYYKGLLHLTLDQNEKALDAFQVAITLDDDDVKSSAYFWLGTLQEANGSDADLIKALASYQTALQLDSFASEWDKTRTYYNQGVVYQNLKRYTEAIQAFETVLVYQPDHYWANTRLGWVLWLQDKNYARDAELYLQKAIQVGPDYKRAYLWLAAIYQKTERVDEARRLYEIVLKIDPQDRDALKFMSCF